MAKKEPKVGDIVEDFGFYDYEIKWHENVYYSVSRYFTDFRFWLKCKYQQIRYGFSFDEAWAFDSYHAKWVTPRLKKLKELKHGFPNELIAEATHDQMELPFTDDEKMREDQWKEAQKKWDEILDKMIWAFENYTEDPEPIMPENYDYRYKVIEIEEDGAIGYKSMDDRKLDWSPTFEHQRKVQEGIDLFAKYHKHLWD